jgi:hypothetical protein
MTIIQMTIKIIVKIHTNTNTNTKEETRKLNYRGDDLEPRKKEEWKTGRRGLGKERE